MKIVEVICNVLGPKTQRDAILLNIMHKERVYVTMITSKSVQSVTKVRYIQLKLLVSELYSSLVLKKESLNMAVNHKSSINPTVLKNNTCSDFRKSSSL